MGGTRLIGRDHLVLPRVVPRIGWKDAARVSERGWIDSDLQTAGENTQRKRITREG